MLLLRVELTVLLFLQLVFGNVDRPDTEITQSMTQTFFRQIGISTTQFMNETFLQQLMNDKQLATTQLMNSFFAFHTFIWFLLATTDKQIPTSQYFRISFDPLWFWNWARQGCQTPSLLWWPPQLARKHPPHLLLLRGTVCFGSFSRESTRTTPSTNSEAWPLRGTVSFLTAARAQHPPHSRALSPACSRCCPPLAAFCPLSLPPARRYLPARRGGAPTAVLQFQARGVRLHNYLNLANRIHFWAHVASARALSLALQTARASPGLCARCRRWDSRSRGGVIKPTTKASGGAAAASTEGRRPASSAAIPLLASATIIITHLSHWLTYSLDDRAGRPAGRSSQAISKTFLKNFKSQCCWFGILWCECFVYCYVRCLYLPVCV